MSLFKILQIPKTIKLSSEIEEKPRLESRLESMSIRMLKTLKEKGLSRKFGAKISKLFKKSEIILLLAKKKS